MAALTPFPYIIRPLNNLQPFTYQDGETYLRILEKMRVWLNNSLVPELESSLTGQFLGFQEGLTNAEQTVVSVGEEWNTRYDAFIANFTEEIKVLNDAAVAGMVEGPGTVRDALDTLFAVEITSVSDALAAHVAATTDALATKADATATTDALATKADADATATELSRRVTYVRTFEELTAAVAAGGTVRVGDAPITFTNEIQVQTPTRIEGGTFILPSDAGYPAFRVTSSNVSFRGCTFDGPGTSAAYSINSRFIFATGTAGTYLKNVNVTDCRMTGSQTENIRYMFVRDSVVERNVMDDFLYAGVLLLSCEDMVVASNTVTNAIMKSPVVNVYGIAATDDTNVAATRSRNIKIIGNTVKNIPWEGIDTHGGEAIIITGNTVIGCGRGIALVTGNDTRLTTPKDCVVSGNYVDLGSATMTDREGIGLHGLSTNLATAVITGNIVKGYQPTKQIYTGNYDPYRTLVEGNSQPHVDWTPITPAPDFESHAIRWEFMVDGRTVHMRGLVTETGTPSTNADVLMGTLPTIAAPNVTQFPKNLRGGSPTSTTTGTVAIYSNGQIKFVYRNNITGTWNYPMDCSWQRRYPA